MEVSVDQLVENIFSKAPQDKKSIQLEFTNSMSSLDLFEFLLELFTNATQKMYGKNINGQIRVDIDDLSASDLDLLKKYFASISFYLFIDIYLPHEVGKLDFNGMHYKNIYINNHTKLKSLKLPLKIKDKVFVVYFDFII